MYNIKKFVSKISKDTNKLKIKLKNKYLLYPELKKLLICFYK